MVTHLKSNCYISFPPVKGNVGFVFICPGRFEERAGKPCAGQTGKILEVALPFLCALKPNIFLSENRYSYLITNAWPVVEYKEKTNRSVPTRFEVSAIETVARLYAEIKDLQYVVACGNLAHLAVELCKTNHGLKAAVAKATHTSRQAFGCPTNEELPIRLWEWADQVAKQFKQV
ncbi:hypothetical protein [Candidatus Skiveiella danica]|jgi:hypothetical protein|uniref:hypothetical protein n=1 Tax=Candidatus Skiveiella danica TaxID=3386177 RepID=UPI00390965EA|nr:hypothetical protein [Comamonadaceae bacterium]MBK6558402.1 hypothetical protein [Comamonadaceae bacterium]MBK9985981.1 hypothetical protein [Betaproteobacteria bacterium]